MDAPLATTPATSHTSARPTGTRSIHESCGLDWVQYLYADCTMHAIREKLTQLATRRALVRSSSIKKRRRNKGEAVVDEPGSSMVRGGCALRRGQE